MTIAHGPLLTNPRLRAIALWAALAALNLSIGVVITLQPERLADLATIAGWGTDWLLNGMNVYASADMLVDYPPHAVVLLSPLALLPSRVAGPFWVIVNLALAVLAPYYAARFFQPHVSLRSILLPILMFGCWWGTHSLAQFSLLALAFAMVALRQADTSPAASGAWLGLALMKPQVAVPVFLWTVFTRRWRVALVALATVAGGVAVFCVRAHASPFLVAERYVHILATIYTGDTTLDSASALRPLIRVFVGQGSRLDVIAGGLAAALLAGICAAGFQEGRWRSRTLYSAPPLAACWSLLTFYQLSYGYVILLPVLMLLAFNDAPQSPLRRGLLWTLQIGMMLNVPGLLRRSGLADGAIAGALVSHFDRFFMLAILAGLVALAWRESAADAT